MQSRLFLYVWLAFALSFLAGVTFTRYDFFQIQSGTIYWILFFSSLVGLAGLPLVLLIDSLTYRSMSEMQKELENDRTNEGLFAFRSGRTLYDRSLINSVSRFGNRLLFEMDKLEMDRQRLRTILEAMNEGVIGLDQKQTILFANRSAGEMLGFEAGDAMGRRIYETVRTAKLQKAIDEGFQSQNPIVFEFLTPTTPARSLTVYINRLQPMISAGVIIVINDVTELRRLEQLRRDFVANVSHELKTPLAVIQSCVENLQDGGAEDPQTLQMFLRSIHDQATRLHSLILDLIHLARIESGQEVFDIISVNLEDSIQDCLSRHRQKAGFKKIELSYETEDSSLQVLCDPEALEILMDNLVDNAIKYTQKTGQVKVSVCQLGEQVQISVSDNGPGIPKDDLPRIFERFYRVDKAHSRETGGTGLGLAIVKHLAQTMKGRIQAQSEITRGTNMILTLPKANSQEPS